MRYLLTMLLIGFILPVSLAISTVGAQQTVPSAIGGFTLNSPISDYGQKHYQNYLNEVIVTDLEGFRKGFITYGTCENPGRILRIKLKYHDASAEFFEELLERYKQAFGSKPKFSGDRFGNVKIWKWTFIDSEGHKVSLALQHNLKDLDESIGNMVKLSLPELMDAERICFNKTVPDDDGKQEQGGDLDWTLLVPR
ncbi:MAG: hypothetical protein LJE64_09885 [Desulfofustis sp.]|nr:hypothetical protein [Desulfofustis sp.]